MVGRRWVKVHIYKVCEQVKIYFYIRSRIGHHLIANFDLEVTLIESDEKSLKMDQNPKFVNKFWFISTQHHALAIILLPIWPGGHLHWEWWLSFANRQKSNYLYANSTCWMRISVQKVICIVCTKCAWHFSAHCLCCYHQQRNLIWFNQIWMRRVWIWQG